MKCKLEKIRSSISDNLIIIGVSMLIFDVLSLAIGFLFQIESNFPLWLSLILLIAGTMLLVVACKKNSRY